MVRKYLSIALALVSILAINHASAQVYTIHAKYSLISIYNSGEDPSLSFDIIDTGYNYTLIADLNKKAITDPTDRNSPLPITEIVHDEGNLFYILKVKPSKYLKWRYYKLMLNQAGEPVYIQETSQQRDRDVKRDTFFHTYTSNLASLSFYQRSGRIKDMTLNEDVFAHYTQANELWKQKWRLADNIVEMRNGYINWTTNGEMHHLQIRKVELFKESGSDGIMVRCTDKDGVFYDITYAYSSKKIEANQHSPERFISIFKIVGHTSVWSGILQ